MLNDYQFDNKTLLETPGCELIYISSLKNMHVLVINGWTKPVLTSDLFNKKDIKYDLKDSNRVEQPLCPMTRYWLNSIA